MRLRSWCLSALLLVGGAGAALACPVCAPGIGLTPAQRMINADRVLYVVPQGDQWTTLRAVKGPPGELPKNAFQQSYAMPWPGPAPADLPQGQPVVVAQDSGTKHWVVIGPLATVHADWLRRVAATKPTGEMSERDWRELVAFHLAQLEHEDPFIAETSYAEIARAPYPAMRTLKPRLDAARIAKWLDDPRLASRRPLYTLLLGVAGGPAAVAHVDRKLDAAARKSDTTDLAALMMADLELHGPMRVAWIEKTYLTGKGRSMPEIQAALLALSEQGTANAAVPRGRVVQAYRTFIRSGHTLAGYPAPALLGWQEWDAVPDYVALLQSKAPQHPASTYAMLNYLDSSPRPEGKAAVAAYRAAVR